jgi:hypothetical protein
MLHPASADTSTPIWAGNTEEENSTAALARREYILAWVLQHAGLRNENTAAVVHDSLTAGDTAHTIAADPFTGAERSLRALAAGLARPQATSAALPVCRRDLHKPSAWPEPGSERSVPAEKAHPQW